MAEIKNPVTIVKGGGESRINQLFLRTLEELTEEDMRGLKSITEANGINGNTGLKAIYIPSTLINASAQAFRNASNLKTINISDLDKYASISFGSLYGCPTTNNAKIYLNGELLTDLPLSNSVTEIKANAFYNCTSLRSLDLLPNSITSIGANAFTNSKIITATIPDSVLTLGNAAFRFCSLNAVVVGSGVTDIGTRCFGNLTSLRTIKFKSINPPTLGTDVFFSLSYASLIFILYNSASAYKTATNWSAVSAKMRGFGTFANGEILPLQTSDMNYSLTWYATIEDMKSVTNPITVGNGEEVYCTFA